MKPAPAVTLRPLTESDIDAIAALDALWHEDAWSRDYLWGYFRDPRCLAYVAIGNAPYVGFAGGHIEDSVLRIGNLAVAPTYRRQGVGLLLIRHIAVIAKEYGLRDLRLEVRDSNGPALALYEKTGFVTVRRLKGYYGAADALEMHRPL